MLPFSDSFSWALDGTNMGCIWVGQQCGNTSLMLWLRVSMSIYLSLVNFRGYGNHSQNLAFWVRIQLIGHIDWRYTEQWYLNACIQWKFYMLYFGDINILETWTFPLKLGIRSRLSLGSGHKSGQPDKATLSWVRNQRKKEGEIVKRENETHCTIMTGTFENLYPTYAKLIFS